MGKIFKTLKLDREAYYETHLNVINSMLPVKMTPMEIKVVAKFMELDGDIAKDRFGTTGRKMVRESLELSSAGLSNYINSLKNKKFLRDIQGKLQILDLLFPERNIQEYHLRFVVNNESNG